MTKKLIVILGMLLFCPLVAAETCPSVDAIKKNTHLQGWKAFDSEDGTPLSAKREAQFKKNIEQFVLAEWVNRDSRLGTIHCYYRDNTGSDLEAYLAKNNFMPQDSKKYWYQVTGSLQCAAGMDECHFKKNILPQTKLAKR